MRLNKHDIDGRICFFAYSYIILVYNDFFFHPWPGLEFAIFTVFPAGTHCKTLLQLLDYIKKQKTIIIKVKYDYDKSVTSVRSDMAT